MKTNKRWDKWVWLKCAIVWLLITCVFKFILFPLKVPKCEIFDRSDFQDFYTIKPMWIGDFGAEIQTCYFNFWGSWAAFNFQCACWACASVPDAYAQCTHQFLTHTLSALISSWHVRSVHASIPDAHAQCTHQFLTHTLSARINSWHTRSVHASVPYAHDERVLKGPFQICNFYSYAEHTQKKLMHMLRVRIEPHSRPSLETLWC